MGWVARNATICSATSMPTRGDSRQRAPPAWHHSCTAQSFLNRRHNDVRPRDQESSLHRPPRRLPVGAELLVGGEVHFRIWAPEAAKVEIVFDANSVEL